MPQSNQRKQKQNGYVPKEFILPPLSKYRQRLDGGVDETTRVNFLGALTPEEMQQITQLLVGVVTESGAAGVVALTRLEFLEPDSCEFRYWTERRDKAQLWQLTLVMLELRRRIEGVHRIRDIDGTFSDSL